MPVLTNTEHDDADALDAVNSTAPSLRGHDAPSPGTTTAPTVARRRRRWPWVVAGLGVAGAGTAAAIVLLDEGGDTAEPEVVEPLATVTAETRDLVEMDEIDGRMVYADTTTATSAADGVVTAVAADASVVERGDVLAEVNAEPITLLYGDVPLYRPLSEGATGDDVEMLEANLASLGHHTVDDEDGNMVDEGFLVDGVWDAATTEAVLRWQDDLGGTATGTVEPSAAVVVEGASVVSDVMVSVGDRLSPGQPLMDLDPIESTSGFHAEHGGDLGLVATTGAELASGDVVYTVDGLPVIAIASETDLDRTLSEGVEPGDDVETLEAMLVGLGYDVDGDLEVDDEFDADTEIALLELEEDLQDIYEDVEPDGILDVEEFVAVEPGTVVGTIRSYDSETIATGTELWSTTSPTGRRIVETEIAVSDQGQLAVGVVVDVRFPDGTVVAGTVIEVAGSSTIDPTNPDAEAVLAVEIELGEVPESAASLNELDVDVLLVDEIAEQVTVVPASALVSLGDGAFAVEAVTEGGTTLVAVEPGLFADGFVEVDGLPAGAQVVVPR